MERNNLIKQLKTLGNTKAGGSARGAWVNDTRSMLMEKAKEDARIFSQTKGKELNQLRLAIDMGATWQKAMRPVVAVAAIILMLFGGWTATVSASYDSLPGDVLYGVKIFSEGAQIRLMPGKEKKTKLRLDFAGRRLEEVAKIVERPVEEKEKKIQTAVGSFKKEIQNVQKDLDEIKLDKNAKKVVEVAREVDRKAEEYEATLKKTIDKVPEETKGQVKEAKKVTEETGVKAVEVLVEKHMQGDVGDVSEDEVIEKLGNKIKKAEEVLAEAEIKEAEVKDEEAIEADEEDGEEIDEPSDEEAAEDSAVSEEGEAAEEEGAGGEEATAQLKVKVEEAKTLLENKDLAGALQTVKEASTLVSAVEGDTETGEEPVEEVVEETGESGEEGAEEGAASSTEETIDEDAIISGQSATTTDEIITTE